MANNTSRGITYPTSGDSISPLETVFATLASTTNTAMGNLDAADIVSGTLPIVRGGTGASTAAGALTSLGAVASADYYGVNVFAGKNKLINADFSIWQRAATVNGYLADRWRYLATGGTSKTFTQSKQTFTPGTAPASGYEGRNFYRVAVSSAGTGYTTEVLEQPIEDVRSLAGQQVTVSFWAKADSARTVTPRVVQNFGTGGSTAVTTTLAAQSITTSWARYSATITVPSISGKTVSSSDDSSLNVGFLLPVNATYTFDFWGIQIEKGATATAFSINGYNQQAELASCQRYYFKLTPTSANQRYGTGLATSTTVGQFTHTFPVTMRAVPTAIETSGTASDYKIMNSAGTLVAASSVPVFSNATQNTAGFQIASTYTAAGNGAIWAAGTTSGYVAWSAEL